MDSKLVFVDSSYFKALIDTKDEFYQDAAVTWKYLYTSDHKLLTTNFILDESLTLIRRRCGLEAIYEFRKNLAIDWSVINIIRIMERDETNAWEWFLKDWSDLSFTDCVSFAVMKRLGLTHVATFDQHFQRAGFKMIKP